jgi:hypothetical protein
VVELQNHDRDHDPQHSQQQLDPPVASDLGQERTQQRVGYGLAARSAIQLAGHLPDLIDIV